MFPRPHRLVEILLSSKHRHPLIATRRALRASMVPGWLLLELCPPVHIWPLLFVPFLSLQVLVFIKCQSPRVIQGRGIRGGVGKSPLFQGPVGAVRAESWCGVRGEGWGGAGWALGRSLQRGMKGCPQLPGLTPVSPSPGSPMGLLGPCWVRWHCAQRSAPQVRQTEGGGRGSLGPPGVGVFMVQGAQGGLTAGNGSEGG